MKKTIAILFLGTLSGFLKAQTNYVEKLPKTAATLPMVFIKGGTFKMGSPKNEAGHFGDEGPQHEVTVDDFWMGQFEVTWDLYSLFMQGNIDAAQPTLGPNDEVQVAVDAISRATPPYTDMSFGMGTEGYPAICMTQLAAVKFCEWLSAMTGHFYRLPTEAEWEYACRAGTVTAFSFGNDASQLEDYAWLASNSNEKYQQVGQKKPNPWGLYDMHGNVAEWTLDQYAPTTYRTRGGTTSNPYVVPTKTYPRTVRGGSWVDDPNRLRSAARRPSSMKWKQQDPQIPKSLWWHTDADFVGFRVLRPKVTPSAAEQKQYWSYESSK
ncbi:MAG: formylglycine-generating enzyme family protein [Flavobacteriaceae bacterium]